MKNSLLLLLAFIVVLLGGCLLIALQGSGNVVTETRDVSNFERVEVCCGMRLILTQGEQEQLTLEADDNILPEIETVVRGETLSVRFRPNLGFTSIRINRPVIVHLQMRTVRGVDISGGGSLETETIRNDRVTLSFSGGSHGTIESLEAENTDIIASGGSQVEIEAITTGNLDIEASGSGRVTIDGGSATEQQVTASGGSHYLAPNVESQGARLEVSGGSEASVWVTESLDVRASGGSDVEYTGNPTIDQELSGGSDLNRVER